MNKLVFAAVYGAIVAVALAWPFGHAIAFGMAPIASSLLTLLVAVALPGQGGASPSIEIGALAVDRT